MWVTRHLEFRCVQLWAPGDRDVTQSNSGDSMPNNSPALGLMVAPIVPVVESETYNQNKKSVWYQLWGPKSTGKWVSILWK